jgi:hypothetical protein
MSCAISSFKDTLKGIVLVQEEEQRHRSCAISSFKDTLKGIVQEEEHRHLSCAISSFKDTVLCLKGIVQEEDHRHHNEEMKRRNKKGLFYKKKNIDIKTKACSTRRRTSTSKRRNEDKKPKETRWCVINLIRSSNMYLSRWWLESLRSLVLGSIGLHGSLP